MRVDIHRNYITPELADSLARWCLDNTSQFVDGVHIHNGETSRIATRLTTRMNHKVAYSNDFFALQKRIEDEFGLSQFEKIDGHGNNGIVVSITYDQGDVYPHLDPAVGEGLEGLRFNILVSQPDSGGIIHVGGNTHDLNKADAMAYLVTKHRHSVEKCFGNPRVLIMFGWKVPIGFWEN